MYCVIQYVPVCHGWMYVQGMYVCMHVCMRACTFTGYVCHVYCKQACSTFMYCTYTQLRCTLMKIFPLHEMLSTTQKVLELVEIQSESYLDIVHHPIVHLPTDMQPIWCSHTGVVGPFSDLINHGVGRVATLIGQHDFV